jgi:hypothetical protein
MKVLGGLFSVLVLVSSVPAFADGATPGKAPVVQAGGVVYRGPGEPTKPSTGVVGSGGIVYRGRGEPTKPATGAAKATAAAPAQRVDFPSGFSAANAKAVDAYVQQRGVSGEVRVVVRGTQVQLLSKSTFTGGPKPGADEWRPFAEGTLSKGAVGNFAPLDRVLAPSTVTVARPAKAPGVAKQPTDQQVEDAARAYAQKKVGPDVFMGRDTGQNTKNIVIKKDGVDVGVRVSTGDNPDKGPQFQDYIVKIKDGKPTGMTAAP